MHAGSAARRTILAPQASRSDRTLAGLGLVDDRLCLVQAWSRPETDTIWRSLRPSRSQRRPQAPAGGLVG